MIFPSSRSIFIFVAGWALILSCARDPDSPGNEDDPPKEEWKDTIEREYTLGVYYYPWHHGDFHGAEYLRKCLSPAQQPVLGEYDDRNTAVLKSHFDWCRYAGIYMLACSWWGPGLGEDITTRDHILPHPDLGLLKVCLHYETAGRTDNFTNLSIINSDIAYMAEHYFDHPNYYRIDGKPVIIVYLTRVLQYRGLLASFFQQMRNSADTKDYDLN